jgi:hypothetical protein
MEIYLSCWLLGIWTNPMGHHRFLHPPSYKEHGNQPCGSSVGQPGRQSLCLHREALCVWLLASDKATQGKPLSGNKHH